MTTPPHNKRVVRPSPGDEFFEETIPAFSRHWLFEELNRIAAGQNLTHHDIANDANLHVNTVKRILSGETTNPSFLVIERICLVLGYDLEVILSEPPEVDN